MKKLPTSQSALAAAQAVSDFIKTVSDLKAITESEDTKRLEIQKNAETLIHKINAEKEIILTTFTKEFEVRKESIDRLFDLLEKDKILDSPENINSVLATMLEIVKSSPLDALLKNKTSKTNEKPVIEI